MARSKRYKELAQKIDKSKRYSLKEAIALLKETATTKFDASIELHARLGIDVTKGDQQVRSTVALPNGSGKTPTIAAFVPEAQMKDASAAGADIVGGEELIAEIKKSGKINFDVAIATPDMMRFMAQIAKVLGPKGLMPSPKNDTVTTDIAKTVEELKKGKVSFKNDGTANVHVLIGKISFTEEQIHENFEAAIDALKKAKPASSKGTYLKNISVNVTMGPGIKVSIA